MKAQDRGMPVLKTDSINSTASGNMIYIEHTTDFEMYSSTSAGAVQGYGYVFHAGKPLDLVLARSY